MKLTIESTGVMYFWGGVRCRLWEATTPSGHKISVFVHRIAIPAGAESAEAERELLEMLEVPAFTRTPPSSAEFSDPMAEAWINEVSWPSPKGSK